MILVDSSVWIDYLRGVDSAQSDLLDRLLGLAPVAVGDLMLAEVLQGTGSNREFDYVRDLFLRLTIIDIAGRDIAIQAARNFRELRQRGMTIRKTINTLIATRCIADGNALLFSDRDFEPFVMHLGLQSALDL